MFGIAHYSSAFSMPIIPTRSCSMLAFSKALMGGRLVNEDAITSVVSLVAAVIGLVTAIVSALAARPRPVTQPQTATQPQMPPRPQASAPGPTAHIPVGSPVPTLKISRSVWLGVAGLILVAAVWAAPLLCYCCVVPGIWIAVHDLRSPGTRRLAATGMALCGLGFALALTDSVIYFSTLNTHG